VGVEHRLRGRAHALARALVIGETARRRGKRDREEKSVAGTHTDGTIGVARCVGLETGIGAEQRVEQVATLRRLTGLPVLRAAIVATQCREQRAALAVALVIHAGALEALQVVHDAVEITAHLRNLAVERCALRIGTAAEQVKETGIVAAQTSRARDHAVELGLLFGGGFFVAADLVGPRRIVGSAAIDCRQLLLEPLADLPLRIRGRRCGLWRINLRDRAHARSRQDRGCPAKHATLL
jgi:hypothetical protein